jgi:hypothetical protein
MFWKVRAIPQPTIWSGRARVMSRPAKLMRPVVGR